MEFKGKKHVVNKNKSFIDSFSHAYEGIISALYKERNMHVHMVMAVLVIAAGVIFKISYAEWLTCMIFIALVITAELINTSIEAVVDMITTKENDFAKVAKDTSAGAVLVVSLMAAFVGLIIFIPKIVYFFMNL